MTYSILDWKIHNASQERYVFSIKDSISHRIVNPVWIYNRTDHFFLTTISSRYVLDNKIWQLPLYSHTGLANPWFDRTLLPNYLCILKTNRKWLWNTCWRRSHCYWNSNLRDWSNLTISHLQNSQNYRTINTRFQLISTHQNFNTQDHHFRY